MSKAIKLGISIGDTNGVGLEVILKSFMINACKLLYTHTFWRLPIGHEYQKTIGIRRNKPK